MNIQNLVDSLNRLEIQIFPQIKENISLKELAKKTNLQEVQVDKALQDLENKNLIIINKLETKLIKKGELNYDKLPERTFLEKIKDKQLSLQEIQKQSKLSQQEINASLGLLRKNNLIETINEKILQIRITEQGKNYLNKESPEEQFLKQLPIEEGKIKDKQIYENLKKRSGLIQIEIKKELFIQLTEQGKQLSKIKLESNTIDNLTKEIIQVEWKNKKFRPYDINVKVPRLNRSKRHFVDQAIKKIKRIWLDLGFEEIYGDHVHTAFWDMDALFVPQDHPAREMQDTFYLEHKGDLPKIYKKIKEAHEKGGDTGSTGYKYKWSEEEASKVLLRTHTTVLSAIEIAKLKKEDLPKKFFSVNKVYRNEALDWKHLFEFYQVEGIVVDPNANFRHLLGYLKNFYNKLGYEKVRVRPGHFPYTEPSVEVEVYHPIKKQWVELGGAGIFRPEVVEPLLGFECPVLAWGQGFERGIAEILKITDIREIYNNDLKNLREFKEI